MPIFGWVRDALGVRKDHIETKKAQLEVKKLEDERREQLIKPPTLDEVKKYDPKTRMIIEKSGGGGCILQVVSYLAMFVILVFSTYLMLR